MYKKDVTTIVLMIFSFCAFAGSPNSYKLTWSAQKPQKIFIEASLSIKDGKFQMAQWGAPQFKKGWANFIEDLRITDLAGNELSYLSLDTARWQLKDTGSRMIKISYAVNLSFTTEKWDYGNEQAGYYKEGVLFLTGMSVFIFTDVDLPSIVTFELKGNELVATPWKKETDKRFYVKDPSQLTSNCFALGALANSSFKSGKFNCHIVLLGYPKETRDLVAAYTKKIVDFYGKLFPNTAASDYLITIFKSDEDDSEAYENSTCISETRQLTKENIISWGNTIAHEIFHSWNGLAIKGKNYAFSQWFSEGFTEYYGTKALFNSGYITPAQFLARIEKNLGLYSIWRNNGAFSEYTLKNAGLRKGRNRAGVYNGGFSTALCLDILIRTYSNNQESLDDVMRDAYATYGLTDKQYMVEDLQSIFKKYLPDSDNFFDKSIAGKDLIMFADILPMAGFDCITNYYDGIVFINLKKQASVKQLRIRRSLINQ